MQQSDLVRRVRSHRHAGHFIAVALIALVTILGLAFRAPITNQLHSWKLLPQPERFSELYFTDHQNLPTVYTPGQTQRVLFTVHNVEQQTTQYTYKVLQRSADDTQRVELASGTFGLRNNAYKTQEVPVVLQDTGARAGVTVELVGQKQRINYWVTKQ